jgi:uncharacterized protein YwqG
LPPLQPALTRADVADQLRKAVPTSAAELVDSLRPAVRFATRRVDGTATSTVSRIGGDPDLPQSAAWPVWSAGPLRFFAQINLEEAHAVAPAPLDLPLDGLLSFFADFGEEGGIIGLYADEREGTRVLYTPPHVLLTRHRSPVSQLPEATLHAIGAWTWSNAIEIRDDEYEGFDAWDLEYEQRLAAVAPPGFVLAGRHQLGGHARPIQHPVEEEVVQAVAGCYERGGSFSRAKWEAAKDQVRDWRLLLQLDSDDELGVMWGDVGTLYWAARQDDIDRGNWSEAMFNFQCS